MADWTDEQLSDLAYLRLVEKLDWPEVADRIGRSVAACKARLAVKEGRRTSNGSIPGACIMERPYEVPTRRPNDDAKHLRLLLAALRREEHLPRRAA